MSYTPIAETTVSNQKVGFETDTMGVFAISPKTGGLPDGFQAVEYIQSSGTQYILVDYYPTNNSGFSAKFIPYMSSNWGSLFDTRVADHRNMFCVNWNTWYHRGMVEKTQNTANRVYLNMTSGEVNEISLINNIVTKPDGTTSTMSNIGTFTSSYMLCLFALNSSGSISEQGSLKLYTLNFYENSDITLEFVPCYCTKTVTGYKGTTSVSCESGTIGLYDLVTEKFYINCGTGEFEKGEDI